jgi:hypothetical protein
VMPPPQSVAQADQTGFPGNAGAYTTRFT